MDRPHRPQLVAKNFIYGSFIINRDERTEPTLQGNNLPGFGDERPAQRYFLSLGYTRILTPSLTNELRAGLNRVQHHRSHPAFTEDPRDVRHYIALRRVPEHQRSGSDHVSAASPGSRRGAATPPINTATPLGWIRGKHSIRMGGEFRRFDNNNFNGGTGGVIAFGTMAAFLAGTPTSGHADGAAGHARALRVNAFGAFVQDDFKVSAPG